MLKSLKRIPSARPARASRRPGSLRPVAARDDILRQLPASGGVTIRELARRVGLSPSALRQHLSALERDGLVDRRVVRGRPGRPAYAYRRASGASRAPADASRLLGTLLRVVGAQGPQRLAETVDAVVGALEAEYGAIREIPDPGARIRAAASVLFNAEGRAQVRATGDGYEVSLSRCSLIQAARESPACCEIARRLLARLSGAGVEQRESLLRGDPRCLFVLRAISGPASHLAKAG